MRLDLRGRLFLNKQALNELHNVHKVFNSERGNSYDNRLDEIEKKIRALFSLFIGYLLGHFLCHRQ